MAQYIDKDALVAEIDNLIDKGKHHDNYECAFRDGNNSALYALKGRIDTLEVKEVDLEKEFNKYTKDISAQDIKEEPFTQLFECVKHFFELGLSVSNKAQKEEKV